METASEHEAPLWLEDAQGSWHANVSRVRSRLKALLANEFARSTRRQVSLETLGLAEVTYPGLDGLAAPDALLGGFPRAGARARARAAGGHFSRRCAIPCAPTASSPWAVRVRTRRTSSARSSAAGAAENAEQGNLLVRFVGVQARQRRRKFAADVLLKCGISGAEVDGYAEEMLRAAFHQLQQSAGNVLPWLETGQQQSYSQGAVWAIRLKFAELGLRRPETLYRSPTDLAYLAPRGARMRARTRLRRSGAGGRRDARPGPEGQAPAPRVLLDRRLHHRPVGGRAQRPAVPQREPALAGPLQGRDSQHPQFDHDDGAWY